MIYGYARLSTDGQSVDAQVKQLRQAGAGKVFRETASGARADRPQLRRALAELGAGDVRAAAEYIERIRMQMAYDLAQARQHEGDINVKPVQRRKLQEPRPQ
jgi:Resolvase, N terminal domain